jgi:response regulator RpfG family c-di-GMP phosphodiesterase
MRGTLDVGRKAVTVVDDEPLTLDVLVRAARLGEFDCQAATSAEQALELLDHSPTPVVVTDLRMPGKGGIWLVREIQRRWPNIGVIVVTAGDDSDAAIECLNAGAQRYFLKPVKLEEFQLALQTTLGAYQLKRARERYQKRLEAKVRQQTRRIRQHFLSAIDSLLLSLEERDPYTVGHSWRVRQYAKQLAAGLGLDTRQCKQLGLAAKLHDIGKFGIPEAILNKPGPLTPAESRLVRKHPVIGERILAPIIRSTAVLSAIRCHHERPDGAGYPDGLAGSQIPVLARVLAIADCFDALTSPRAYRPAALVNAEAMDFIRQGAGSQFDAAFVDVFLNVLVPLPKSHRLEWS